MNALTRRPFISGAAVSLIGISTTSAFAGSPQAARPSSAPNATRTSLHQEIDLKTTPARIYAVLLDSKQFAAFSHELADIHGEPGGTFSMFGARILGRNVELVPNQRIVQAWREISWDAGVYSLVKFELVADGTGTKLVFDHTGFPSRAAEHLAAGWRGNYWDPIDKFLS